MSKMLDISECQWIKAVEEWYRTSPSSGYIIVLALLLLWLVGVIAGWKWTYQPGSWLGRLIADEFGPNAPRLATAVALVIAIGCTLLLWLK